MKRLLFWTIGIVLLGLVLAGSTLGVLINPPLLIPVLIFGIFVVAIAASCVVLKIIDCCLSWFSGGRSLP